MPDYSETAPVAVEHGPLVDGLPLCDSCFVGHHACAGGDCSCQVLACVLEVLRARFHLIPSHAWIASRLLAPPSD